MKLITLKPLTPYFFGYNDTFSQKGSNYFVRSALYPQQTTILGMIRKEILIQSGLLKRGLKDEWVLKDDYQKAKELVGSGKYGLKSNYSLGKIKYISPLFLYNKEIFFEAPNVKEIKKENYYVVDFDYKGDVFDTVYSNTQSIKKSDIFQTYEIAFNSKKDSEDSYFKKIAYKLNNFCFGFFLDVDFELKNSIVNLGADNSLFELKVQDSKITFDDIEITLPIKSKEKLSLVVGDSQIDNLEADFGIVDEVMFKTIKQYGGKKGAKFIKSKPISLYKKGSLFVNLKNKLTPEIGFNTIKEIKCKDI
jgi:CRISPR-associated protein Cmr3